MKTAIKSSRPLFHFSNEGQKLAIFLENEVFQNLTLLKSVKTKNALMYSYIYFNEKKIEKDSDFF